ncbi:hypothetical protein N7454_010311 [Penicillium verhagenii]|nr:hypothetical protein N7454_010311 [Penicillium verhagenii]
MATKITPAMEIEIAAYAAHYRPAIISISLCLGAIATILILLRIYSYFRVVRNKGGWALSAAIVAWASHLL